MKKKLSATGLIPHFAGLIILTVFCGIVNAQNTVSVTVNAGTSSGLLSQLWGDHYDLSMTHPWGSFTTDPNFLPLMQQVQPRYWRCSVGRWEMGYPAPFSGNPNDTTVLKTIPREYYRGGNDLTSANNPANYYFTYLDDQLTKIELTGAKPYLCFDYMPFTLSSQQNPNNPNNDSVAGGSFSNGIRTAPPSNPAVYARVVRNTIRHLKGLFAGTTDFGIKYFEIGNEPDVPAPNAYFWTGTVTDFYNMYSAIISEINSDPQLVNSIKIGAGAFSNATTPTFATAFMNSISSNSTRLDFLSYHSYSDSLNYHYFSLMNMSNLRNAHAPNAELINSEWGRLLNNSSDTVYDHIEHGVFRAQVMLLMESFGVKVATEAVFIDPPIPAPNKLGLVFSGPIAPKPATDCYIGLNKMNDCLNALPVTTVPSTGEFVYSGKDSAGTKVCIVYVGDDPGGFTKKVNLQINNLPWGSSTYYMYQYEVSENTWSLNQGVKLQRSDTLNGSIFNDSIIYGPGPGQGRLLIWKLSTAPLTGIQNLENLNGILIYPNPFSYTTTLQTDNPLHNATLTVYNCYGQEVTQSVIPSTPQSGATVGRRNLTITRDGLPGGIYFLRLTALSLPSPIGGGTQGGGGEVFTGKLIITDK
ncbi:MAG: T9SS type A sorting domain-containing protein [Bacteroidetes bacterium]|nr:T9SS type A sorting domain-containing protein [Bacteroidota bacterium]